MTAKCLQHRNREIGSILEQIRETKHRSVTECAAVLGTSRRRYRAIELGEVGISAAELEILINYLEVPVETIWGGLLTSKTSGRVVLHAHPGEKIELLVQVES